MEEPLKYVDSNVFFYAKILDAKYGEACARIINDISKGKLKVAIFVLVALEVSNALTKYGFADEVKDEINAIYSLDISVNVLDNILIREAIDIYNKIRISPYDCVHAALMKKLGINEIISADKDFDKIPKIKRIDPLLY